MAVPKILLAEDGPDHARILIAVLKQNGIEVEWHENGLDAYDYLWTTEKPPDLLITDVMMPVMTGFELLARLKADGKMPPTIVLTSRQSQQDVLEGLQFGISDYIVKPFTPMVVLTKIRNVLTRARQISQSAA